MKDAYYKAFFEVAMTDGLTPEQQAELAAILVPHDADPGDTMACQPALMDRSDARGYLGGISETTMWRLAGKGLLHPIQIGTRIMYERRDLDRYIRTCRRGGPGSGPRLNRKTASPACADTNTTKQEAKVKGLF